MADHNLGVYRPRPRGDFDSTKAYKYLDIVRYNGSTYININLDTIDGTSSIGILPEGQVNSKQYWQLLATKGDKGDIADSYNPFIELTDGNWDYSLGDKVFIDESVDFDTFNITNVYNGCCGIIITRKELPLPQYSLMSVDYDFVHIHRTDDYYFYSFIYAKLGSNTYKFIWHRTVINDGY